jgi:excisionase family DNA binding protein
MADDNRMLSPREAGKEIGVCPTTVRRWIKRGMLEAFKFNARVIKVRQSDLEKLIAGAKI